MDTRWKNQIRGRWVTAWGWLLCLPMIWLPLRAAYSFALPDDVPLDVHALWKPALYSFGIALAFPLLGFFFGWSSLARRSIFKGDFITADDASLTVVRAVWFAAIIYCLLTVGLLTAFKKLELSGDVWSLASAGIGTLPPIATLIKQWLR